MHLNLNILTYLPIVPTTVSLFRLMIISTKSLLEISPITALGVIVRNI